MTKQIKKTNIFCNFLNKKNTVTMKILLSYFINFTILDNQYFKVSFKKNFIYLKRKQIQLLNNTEKL